VISSYGGIKDCTKDCQRTIPHSSYEKAPWMCKVKADNEDSDDYRWDLLDLDWLLRYRHGENRLCCGQWGNEYCGDEGLPEGVTDPGPPHFRSGDESLSRGSKKDEHSA